MTATEILEKAAGHLKDRAATYDKPQGERSMAAAVRAFVAVTGDGLMNTPERGWLFMVLLKAVRSQQGAFRADNYEDGAAYFALAGEAAQAERQPMQQLCAKPKTEQRGWPGIPEAAEQVAAQAAVMESQEDDGWIEWKGGECPVNEGVQVNYRMRMQHGGSMASAGNLRWDHDGGIADIIAYRVVTEC